MSTSRTFTVVKSSAVVSGDAWTFTRGEIARQNFDQAAYCGLQLDLGGSETEGVLSTAFAAVPGARAFTLDGDTLGGLTLDVVLSVYTPSTGVAVQARLRNTTDGSNAALGTSSSVASVVTETKTVTLASGPKSYRLEVTADGLTAPVSAFGYVRFRKVAS